MKQNRNIHLIIKVLLVGGLFATLTYLFHPAGGQFSVMINGEPVADPIVRFAAIPTLLAVLFFTGILTVLAFFGVGLFIFLAALMFMMLGFFVVAPYSWPVLLIIILMIALMSFGDKKNV